MPWRIRLLRLLFSFLSRSFMKTQRRSDNGGSLPSPSQAQANAQAHDDYDDYEDVESSVETSAEVSLDISEDSDPDFDQEPLDALASSNDGSPSAAIGGPSTPRVRPPSSGSRPAASN